MPTNNDSRLLELALGCPRGSGLSPASATASVVSDVNDVTEEFSFRSILGFVGFRLVARILTESPFSFLTDTRVFPS